MTDRLLRLLALFTLTFTAVAAARAFGTLLPLPMQLASYEAIGAVAHIRLIDVERGTSAMLLRFEDADTQKAPLLAGWLDHERLLLISGGTERIFATWTLADGVQPLDGLPLTCRLPESRISVRGDSAACTTFEQRSVRIQQGQEEAWEYRTDGTLLDTQLSADGRYLLLDRLENRDGPWRIFEVIDIDNRVSIFSYELELLRSDTVMWSTTGHWLMFGCNAQDTRQSCLLDLSTMPPRVITSEFLGMSDYYVRSPDNVAYLFVETRGQAQSALLMQQNSAQMLLYATTQPSEQLLGARWSPDGELILVITEVIPETHIRLLSPTQPDSAWTVMRSSARFSISWRPCPEAAC
jgi:hypothetical protein